MSSEKKLCAAQHAFVYCNCCSAHANAQGNQEQRGTAEKGRQHEGKMATAYLARSKEPGSLVQGSSLEEQEAISALKAVQQ